MFSLFSLNSLLTMDNRFAAAKIDMQKKRRAKKVDLVDEINYKKAQFAEEARLKRQELDHLASREILPRSVVYSSALYIC